jgi:aryl-alcohol dehydrogenase-like predicted oxidoreductase
LQKIALGTAQFGMPYGINNSGGIPSANEFKTIFLLAINSGIHVVDTAPGYGDAEIKIAQFSDQKLKVVTKFSIVNNIEALKSQLTNSLLRLKTNSLYGYLSHNADMLLTHPILWSGLLQAKKDKLIEKIGYSLYSCEQLEKLLALNFIPDLVQIPYSLLDRKFESFFPQLKELGTEIHVRSVFLQGLYFMDASALPEKLKPLKSSIHSLQQYCKMYSVSMASLALNFVIGNKNIDHVIIGVDNASQLQQNIELTKTWKHNPELLERVNQIELVHKELLNPTNW